MFWPDTSNIVESFARVSTYAECDDPHCETCEKDGTCTFCNRGVAKEKECVSECGEGYHLDDGVCYACKDRCSKCDAHDDCDACEVPYVLKGVDCVVECGEGYTEVLRVCRESLNIGAYKGKVLQEFDRHKLEQAGFKTVLEKPFADNVSPADLAKIRKTCGILDNIFVGAVHKEDPNTIVVGSYDNC